MSHHVSFNDLPQGGEKFEPAKGGKLIGALGLFGLLGIVVSLWFFFKNTDTFAYSWLFAVFFTFTFVVGGCFWILLHSVSNSSWRHRKLRAPPVGRGASLGNDASARVTV